MTLPAGVLDELRARLAREEAHLVNHEIAFENLITRSEGEPVRVLRDVLARAEQIVAMGGRCELVEWNRLQGDIMRIRACGWGDAS